MKKRSIGFILAVSGLGLIGVVLAGTRPSMSSTPTVHFSDPAARRFVQRRGAWLQEWPSGWIDSAPLERQRPH